MLIAGTIEPSNADSAAKSDPPVELLKIVFLSWVFDLFKLSGQSLQNLTIFRSITIRQFPGGWWDNGFHQLLIFAHETPNYEQRSMPFI